MDQLEAFIVEKFISIHVPREGDDNGTRTFIRLNKISIHVPREGDDGGRPHGGG